MTQDPQGSAWEAPHHDQQGYGPPLADGPPPPAYGPPAYGPPTQGYGPPTEGSGYAGVPVAQGPPAPTSAVVLVVLSGVLALLGAWTVVGLVYLAPTVLGVVSLTRHRVDPSGARRLTRVGWLVLGIVTGLFLLLLVALFVVLLGMDWSSGYDGPSV